MQRTFSISIASILVLALTWFAAPARSQAVMAQAESRHPAALRLNVTVEGKPGADGWYSGPALARAETDSPQAVITYSINGGPTTQGREILLAQPGQYQIVWNACVNQTARLSARGEACPDSFMQLINIALMEAEPLAYDQTQRRWSFTGRVLDVREVSLMGFSGQVARVQSRNFAPWVVLKIDQVSLSETPVETGQWVQVAIAGPHVSKKVVDWSACVSDQRDYCYFGEILDSGLESPDTDFLLTPSNELIHLGRSSPSWRAPGVLYWNTTVLSVETDVAEPEQGPYLVGQFAEGEYNGNPEGWYRSPTVLARMNVAGGQARLYYQLDQQPKQRTFTGLVPVTGEGEHQLVWRLETGETVTEFIRIDTRGPLVQWNAESEVYLSGVENLSGQAADPELHSGLQAVEISFDGGKTWEIHPATTPGLCRKPEAFFWNFHWDTTQVKNGNYFLLARGRDYAGNLGATAVWNVVVNNP